MCLPKKEFLLIVPVKATRDSQKFRAPRWDAHRWAWLRGMIHTAELFKNSNISAKSKPNSKILKTVYQRPRWVWIMKKWMSQISWHTPFKLFFVSLRGCRFPTALQYHLSLPSLPSLPLSYYISHSALSQNLSLNPGLPWVAAVTTFATSKLLHITLSLKSEPKLEPWFALSSCCHYLCYQ